MKKVLSFFLAAAMTLALVPAMTVAAANVPTLTVDMTAKTGPMRHGSAGFLYGLGSHGTPNANTLTPLKPGTAVQKAPDGLQHPTGDVLDVAETFIEAGGEQVQIYLQDIFALWDYEYTTIDDYLERIKEMVPKIVELRESRTDFDGKFVYVPYNEPDGIWFQNVNNDTNVQNRLNEYWKKAYDLIRELDPEALIGGISFATYQYDAMDRWLRFCAANGCEPDYITWHELQNDKLSSFTDHLNHYRWVEKDVGMDPREIIINEYAPQDHCAVPGKLVNWIALFEENKVSGCLPYWHNAGNLDDIAADNNEPNGAWWLYKWYGDMSGETLKLTTSTARDRLYGLASIDDNKKSANVIFGGVDGTSDIVLENIDKTEAFAGAEKVNIKIEATYFSAFHGVAAEPTVIRTGTYAVEGGRVTVELDGMEASAAYNITVTAAGEDDVPGTVYRGPWRMTWEAEDAVLTGKAHSTGDPWTYAKSGGSRVTEIEGSGDGVDFTVSVPQTGYYRADLIYGNGVGLNTSDPSSNNPVTVTLTRSVDGEEDALPLENTLREQMTGMYTDYIELDAGEHTVSYRGTGQAASIDCLSLTYAGGEIPEFDSIYEAELGDFNTLLDNETTTVTTESSIAGYSASGYVTGLDEVSVEQGGGVRFTVVVPDNGLYNVTLRYAADTDTAARLYLDNTALTLDNLLTEAELPASADFASSSVTVFLQKGINILDVDTEGAAALDYIRVRASDDGAADVIEAEDGILTGGAAVSSEYAHGGGYVADIKAAQTYENLRGDFTVTGMNDGLMSYESSAQAQLIYADYDGGKLTAVKRVPLPEGEAAQKLETGHDKIFVWLGLSDITPLVKFDDKAEGGSLEIKADVPEAGVYKMVMRYSNSELFGAHSYNAQIVDRYASYSVNGGEAERVYFKNTYSDENWRTVTVPVTLEAGENTVKFFNDNWRIVRCGVLKPGASAHLPENIDYQTLVNYAPNLDSFEFYPSVLGASQAEEKFKVSVMATEGGIVSIDKTSAAYGETVTVTIEPDYLGGGYSVTVNGEDATAQAADGVLKLEITENTDIRVAFATPENGDDYILNNSFGTGNLTGWLGENVAVEGVEGSYRAVLGQGGSLSQTIAGAAPGYYTLTFKADGEGRVSFGASEADISGDVSVTTYAAGDTELKITGSGLTVDEFKIESFLPVDTELLYFVDCGDRDTSTLSAGDMLGLNNSSTEQFYAADPVTGKMWGVDDVYTANASYPDLLTGKDTWPYEQGGADDGCSKAVSYRYAKDQVDHVGPGVTYKFELEDGVYTFETGFYCAWGKTPNRKSSLKINGSTVASGILPSTDASNPLVISSTVTVTGGTATLNLNLDSDGAGGPMISWIKIYEFPYERIDTAGMTITGTDPWSDQWNPQKDFAPNAFDGNEDTFFDGLQGGWVQIDLGTERDIAAIGYVPRSAYPERMRNGVFEVSKDGGTWTALYKVTSAPSAGNETKVTAGRFLTEENGWRYLRYRNDSDYCNVAEIYIYE